MQQGHVLKMTRTPERLVLAKEGKRGIKGDTWFGPEQLYLECHLFQWEAREKQGQEDG